MRVGIGMATAGTRRNGRLASVFLAAAAIGLVGCSAAPTKTDDGQLRQQAQDVLDRWSAAVAKSNDPTPVVVVGDATGQIGDWEAEVGDNNKRALMAGLVLATDGLASESPATGTVTWQDGETKTVPLISAGEALGKIGASAVAGACIGCTPLTVTGATLTTARLSTSRGPATVPVWAFAVAGTSVKVTRVAIADTPYVEALDEGSGAISGIRINAAIGAHDGRDVTVTFVGAGPAQDKPCGADYTAAAVESKLAVVVIVIEHPNPLPAMCDDVGHRRTAIAALASPLGDRVVLDLVSGQPVTLTLSR